MLTSRNIGIAKSERKKQIMTTVTTQPSREKVPLRPTKGQARFAFTILLIINILNYADRYLLPAVLPKIQKDFGLTPFQEGLLGSSFLFVYALATLPVGVWADRSIRKKIIALCVGIWSVATGLAGFTSNFLQLFTVRSILGIGEAGYAPASLSLLGDLFSKTRRGRILSYWSSGQLIGAAFGLNAGETLTTPAHASLAKDFWGSIKKLRQIPTYWTLVVALVFSFFTIGGTTFWMPTYVVDTFHLSVSQAGVIAGGVVVGSGLIGTVAGGWLADFAQRRRPEGRLLVAALGFLLGTPLVLIALSIHTLPLFIAVFVVAGIFLTFCVGPLNAVIQDVIMPGMRATALGLALLLAHLLGDAAAPLVIGAIASAHSLFFALIITAPIFLFLAGLICLLGLRTVARDMQRMQEQMRISEKAG